MKTCPLAVSLVVVLLCACPSSDDTHGDQYVDQQPTDPSVLPDDPVDGGSATHSRPPAPCGDPVITTDTVVPAGSGLVRCNTVMRGALTIQAGAQLRFAPGVTLIVQGPLRIEGTPETPVTMSGFASGRWGFAILDAPQVSMKNVTISGSGLTPATKANKVPAAGLYVQVSAAPIFVENVTISDSEGTGWFMPVGGFAEGSNHLTIENSGDYPLFIKTRSLMNVPTGSYSHNPKPTVLVDTCGDARFSTVTRLITTSTIRALDVPYTFGVGSTTDFVISTVQDGPPTFETIPVVTLEPGVTFQFPKVTEGAASRIRIDSALDGSVQKPLGVLIAKGTDAAPIVFTSAEAMPAAGDWATIDIEALDLRTQLDHVVIAYAGADSSTLGPCAADWIASSPFSGNAALQLFGDEHGLNHNPFTNSVITHSAGAGILRAWHDVSLDLEATNTLTDIAFCRQTSIPMGSVCLPADCR